MPRVQMQLQCNADMEMYGERGVVKRRGLPAHLHWEV